MSVELEHIWTRVQAELALAVDEPTYRIWLSPLRPLELDDQRLLLEAPSHARRWIQERFGRILQASVATAVGEEVRVELVEPAQGGVTPKASAPSLGIGRAHPTGSSLCGDTRPPIGLDTNQSKPENPKLTFEHFVIGDSNRLAHAAALTVAEMPSQAYNPLFLCGPPGVGKTHLLSSIANLLLSHNPGLTVRTTTGEAFTNEFLGALNGGNTEGFKSRFRHIDVLLVDDVQFLERKTKTEEEFFHTFNALHDGGRQIVLTSDRPPHDLQALEDRLRERFQAGLVADVKPPDLSTRMAILRKRAAHDQIPLLDDRALTVIAERVHTNVRALEGALIRVVAFSSLTGRPITPELAEEVLKSLYPSQAAQGRPRRTVEEIQAATCDLFGISPTDMLSSTRKAQIAWPRQLAMYLSRELTGESLPAIGQRFGGRDHTTVMHACRRTLARIDSDQTSLEAVQKLCRKLDCPQP